MRPGETFIPWKRNGKRRYILHPTCYWTDRETKEITLVEYELKLMRDGIERDGPTLVPFIKFDPRTEHLKFDWKPPKF